MSGKICSNCQSAFECGSGQKGCWCEGLFIDIETLQSLRFKFDNCLCQNCLKEYADTNNKNKK